MNIKLLTKVVKGVAYGDVSNHSIRNILTEISKEIGGRFTEQEMYDTLDFFDWKCPYTGKDLKPLIENGTGEYATDHIYPQNKEWCGLNVKGNLVIVDKTANSKKQDQDVEKFLLHDTNVIKDIDEIGRTREERLKKIKEFQALCKYDPENIRKVISELLKERYVDLRTEQEQCIQKLLGKLKEAGIVSSVKKITISDSDKGESSKQSRRTKNLSTELIFFPADEKQFKDELLQKKKARFILTYDSGIVKESFWDAKSFDKTSNLRGNIQSRPFWRCRETEGLIRAEVHIEDSAQ